MAISKGNARTPTGEARGLLVVIKQESRTGTEISSELCSLRVPQEGSEEPGLKNLSCR